MHQLGVVFRIYWSYCRLEYEDFQIIYTYWKAK